VTDNRLLKTVDQPLPVTIIADNLLPRIDPRHQAMDRTLKLDTKLTWRVTPPTDRTAEDRHDGRHGEAATMVQRLASRRLPLRILPAKTGRKFSLGLRVCAAGCETNSSANRSFRDLLNFQDKETAISKKEAGVRTEEFRLGRRSEHLMVKEAHVFSREARLKDQENQANQLSEIQSRSRR
jgi:hypothetical protein